MAGAGWKLWTRERLSSSDLQKYIQDQVVMQFDSVAQRDAVLPASVSDGTVTYLEDLDWMFHREGGSSGFWRPLGSQWPDQATGGAFPSNARPGDYLWSDRYECPMMYIGGGSWRQVTPPIVDGLTAYRDRLIARGVTALHNGFLIMQAASNRLYNSTGGALSGTGTAYPFQLLNGPAGARVTTGWPAAGSGWTYNSPATFVESQGNGMALVYCEVTRSGAALTPSAIGDLTNAVIGTVPSNLIPSDTTPLHSGGAGRVCSGSITTAGDISLAATTSGGNIGTGDVISLGGMYRLAYPDL